MHAQLPVRFRTKGEVGYQPKEFGLKYMGSEETVKIPELEKNKLRPHFRPSVL